MKVVNRTSSSRKFTKGRARAGYTLAEALVVVAIIVVLLGVVFIAAGSIKRNMEQNKLDTIAQDIYVAAQDHMAQLYTDNRIDEIDADEMDDSVPAGVFTIRYRVLAETTREGGSLPADWDGGIEFRGHLLATSKDQTAAVTEVLMPKGILSDEVYNNHYIIEYNPDYGYIYGVYYSEKGFDPAQLENWYNGGKADNYRTKANRLGNHVGYYGGGGVLGGKVEMTNTTLSVTANVINAEELKLELVAKIPTEYVSMDARLTVTITGKTSGKTATEEIILTRRQYGKYTRQFDLILDSLKTGKSFAEKYSEMIPGEDLSITVTAELGSSPSGVTFTPNRDIDTDMVSTEVNSLFDHIAEDSHTAYLSAGRHLQNLNRVNNSMNLSNAAQCGSIDFRYTDDDETDDVYWWAETYGDLKFEPITNTAIVSFNGSDGTTAADGTLNTYTITGMTVQTAAAAGMFGEVNSLTFNNVSMIGSHIESTGSSAGALAGVINGSVAIENSGAYLDYSDYYAQTYETTNAYIKGTTAGGLVGTVTGTADVKGSFAAEVVKGSTATGGLFGSVSGKMTVANSYADSYLVTTGGTAGGMAGSCAASSTISASYTAGFAAGTQTKIAGFVPGRVASISNSYTVLDLGRSAGAYIATVESGTATKVYYAEENAGYGDTDNFTKVGTMLPCSSLRSSRAAGLFDAGSFDLGSNTERTTAYNLAEGLGLSTYPYPVAKYNGNALRHYSDWVNGIEPGTLVYFEEYTDGTRGFYGAGSNYLQNGKTVAYDGYTLIYTRAQYNNNYGKVAASITTNGVTQTIAALTDASPVYTVATRSVTGATSTGEYMFRDLPYSVVNAAAAANTAFYSQIIVNTPDTANATTGEDGKHYYYFNPHFANTVVEADDRTPTPSLAKAAAGKVTVRTARQLYLFGENYDRYGSNFRGITFNQELDINYATYAWTSASLTRPAHQKPIAAFGSARAKKFNGTYNGLYH